MVDGEESTESSVTSGLPQGSVLGPAMLLFYINNLLDELGLAVKLFADDTIVYNTTNNHQELQDNLAKLEQWERLRDMEFQPAKCQQISFSRKRKPARLPLYLHCTEIPKADIIKYLGVTIDSKVNWNAHVISTAAKGHLSLGFVRHNILTTSE